MQAAEPSLECDSNYSCSKKNSSSCFKEHESNESTECRLNIKQETQAAEPSVLIRAIRIIRVLKNSSLCFK